MQSAKRSKTENAAPPTSEERPQPWNSHEPSASSSAEEALAHPLERFILDRRKQRIDQVLHNRTRSLTIVCDHVHNAHNISAVIRSAEAFGLQEFHYVGEHFATSNGITLGVERWIDIVEHRSADDAARQLVDEGFEIVVLQPAIRANGERNEQSVPVTELPFDRKLALVFGNEVSGVSPAFEKRAQHAAHIPMYGFVESLNISVAAAICLFCSTLSGAKSKRMLQSLQDEDRESLRERWLERDVPGGTQIMEKIREEKKRCA